MCIRDRHGEKPSVAIAYDSRNKSELFAREAAGVLAANGVTAHVYPWLSPTPTLSYAVRRLKCDAGICVTASHNPAKYNGYKAYGADGCQVTAEMADDILNEINALDIFADVRHMDFETGKQNGLICMIDERVLDSFLDEVYSRRVLAEPCDGLKVVYTPLNGTGRVCVTRILRRIGVRDVVMVPEQEMPDGNFTTCPYPNPEIREALQKGLELSAQVQPDLLLATDPDCDRCGIAVRHGDGFRLMTGNEVGILLLDFIAGRRQAHGTLPEKPVLVTDVYKRQVRIGAMICYDREFPESARILMLQGAEVILVPNACPMQINRLAQLRARAYENMAGVATANYAYGQPDCNGHSSAFDGIAYRDGEGGERDMLLLDAGEAEGIYLASFPLAELRAYRENEVHGNAYRHPGKYKLLVAEERKAPFVRADYRG